MQTKDGGEDSIAEQNRENTSSEKRRLNFFHQKDGVVVLVYIDDYNTDDGWV